MSPWGKKLHQGENHCSKVHWKEHWTQSQEQRGQVLALPLTLDMTVYPEALVR